jgi:hypothetical protein
MTARCTHYVKGNKQGVTVSNNTIYFCITLPHYEIPNLWNISSRVLKATGFTRLKDTIRLDSSPMDAPKLTSHLHLLRKLAAYPLTMTFLSGLGCV